MVITLFFPIVDSAVRKAGSVTFLDLADDLIGTMDIKIRILLASKAGVRQVLSRGTGANGYIGFIFIHLVSQLFIGSADGILKILGHFLFHDGSAQAHADRGEKFTIFHIRQFRKDAAHLFAQARLVNEIPISMGRRSKAIRHRNIGLGRHFPKRRGFAADNVDVFSFQLFKPQQISI